MRTTETTLVARSLVRTRSRSPGEQWVTRLDATKTLISSKSLRDDVQRNPLGSRWKPPLAYVSSGSSSDYPGVNYTAVYTAGGVNPGVWDVAMTGYIHDHITAPALTAIIPQADKNRAIVNMLRSVGDQKWAAGETLVEMQASVDMIGSSARKLSNALFAASKRNWSGVAKALSCTPKKVKNGSTEAQGWLAYQFGWKPVVDDIANAALYLGEAFDSVDPPIIMARTKLSDARLSKRTGAFEQPFGVGVLVFGYTEFIEQREDWKASVYYTVSSSQLRELSQYGIVGLSTPWAVLPSSYLADWILPIGDVLAALDATMGITYKGGSQTTFLTGTKDREWSPAKGSIRVTNILGTVHSLPATKYDMVRSVWKTSPFPSPLYIKNPLDTFKAVTSVALLKQYSSK